MENWELTFWEFTSLFGLLISHLYEIFYSFSQDIGAVLISVSMSITAYNVFVCACAYVYVCVWVETLRCRHNTGFCTRVCLQCCLLALHNSSREGQSSDGKSGWRRRIERKRYGGRERKRDCEWYQWNLFVCTLLSRLRPLVRWCHALMSLWSEVTGLWRQGLFFFFFNWVSPTTLHYLYTMWC